MSGTGGRALPTVRRSAVDRSVPLPRQTAEHIFEPISGKCRPTRGDDHRARIAALVRFVMVPNLYRQVATGHLS